MKEGGEREKSRASVRIAWAHERRCCCWWFTLSANRPNVATFTLTFLCIVSLSIIVSPYFFLFYEKREDSNNVVLRSTGLASKRKTTMGKKKLNDLSLPSTDTNTRARARIYAHSLANKGWRSDNTKTDSYDSPDSDVLRSLTLTNDHAWRSDHQKWG